MAFIEKISQPIWSLIYKNQMRHQRNPRMEQEATLGRFLRGFRGTVLEKDLNLKQIRTYQDYLWRVPVQGYANYKSYIDRIAAGEKNVLFRDPIRAFVQTSGTTGYLNKLIPYNEGMLGASLRYQVKTASVVGHFSTNVNPLFHDRFSYATVIRNVEKYIGGIPKANASELWTVNKKGSIGQRTQVLDAETLSGATWQEKLDKIVKASHNRDIRIVSGIPLYLIGVFEHMLAATGKSKLVDLWPNLEVCLYSGSSVESFRTRLNDLAGRPLRFFGGYLASEGLFGIPTPDGRTMHFNLNSFLFAFRESGSSQDGPLLGVDEVEPGREYQIYVGCPNGFLNFEIGDLVRIESVFPQLTFTVLGRDLSINVANEKTSHARLEKVAQRAQKETGIIFENYFVHPSESYGHLPVYVWTIVTDDLKGLTPEELASHLDRLLLEEAPDYKDCRVADKLLGTPQVQVIPRSKKLAETLLSMNQHRGQFKMKSVFRSSDEFRELILPAAQKTGLELRV